MIEGMNDAMLRAILETMPSEITVIDANDEVVGWNKHEKRIFRRPLTSMGLNFRECHPEASLHKVVAIIDEMKGGARDEAVFWIDLGVAPGEPKHKILIEFFALRDDAGNYLGCLEHTRDVEWIRGLEGERRLLAR
jgi:DUF438 domain-containing protein